MATKTDVYITIEQGNRYLTVSGELALLERLLKSLRGESVERQQDSKPEVKAKQE